MNTEIYALILSVFLIALAAIIVYEIKNNVVFDKILKKQIGFSIVGWIDEFQENGTIDLFGTVKNYNISIGDVFDVIDSRGKIMGENVKVIEITSGAFNRQKTDTCEPKKRVTLTIKLDQNAMMGAFVVKNPLTSKSIIYLRSKNNK